MRFPPGALRQANEFVMDKCFSQHLANAKLLVNLCHSYEGSHLKNLSLNPSHFLSFLPGDQTIFSVHIRGNAHAYM